ncbi:P-loop containing nucleoside triphosphate hydrolase protein [Mycena rosella]|uniref:P-loop containing nucleoside triphosphate hydrolase protein n=1 Tax=Mycena rosella TaxID=1033263 RepID=A0AAD7G0D6_MYCRO|nr:P-loop containing nucleoside triphosphate hydrolase protein [Mycena rosella]
MNNCPPASKIFHGREIILARMHKYYAEDMRNQRIFLLHGLGGAGKTQIALKFIEESTQFSNVFLIDASTPDTIDIGLMNIAISKNSGSNAQDALRWLGRTSEEWLLIFDNADDPKINLHNYFPLCKHGNIVITSRNPGLAVHAGAHTAVSDMEEVDSVELLLKSASQDSTPQNREVAAEIVKVSPSFCNLKLISILILFQELCYFPLAIIQAGAFISKSGALNSYLAYYSANRVRLLSEKPAQSHDDYGSTVYTTWQISFDQLTPLAATLLQLCSFLHHQGISEQIFCNASMYTFAVDGPSKEELQGPLEILSHFTETTGAWDSLRFMDLIHELIGYSLISFAPVTKMFSIHPLVHKWSQSTVADPRGYHSHMVAIAGMSFGAIPEEAKHVASLQLLAHVDSLLQGDTAVTFQFGVEYAQIYRWVGRYKKAESLALAVLERRRDTFTENHPATLTAMNCVARINFQLGRLTQAEALQGIVLEKRKTVLGEDHPETLITMLDLARTYHELGRLQEAQTLQSVVFEKRKIILGEDHPATLIAMGNLLNTYSRLGRPQEVEALQSVVFQKRKTVFGEDHPETLIAMNNLAKTYHRLGRLQEAEALQSVVFEKRKTISGENHPATLIAMGNLAETYHQLGRLQEAEALQNVVFEKRKTIFGEHHPETLSVMGNLARTYYQLGQLQEAEALQSVVFQKRKTIWGEDHPHTLIAMAHLAKTYHRLGRKQEAEALGQGQA